MDTVIVVLIVGWAVVYLVKRYTRLFRPRVGDGCQCGCSGCGQASTCDVDSHSIQPKP